MKTLKNISINSTTLFWGVYIGFLFVLWPQAAWTVGQLQDTSSVQWSLMGVTASPLAWALSGVIEITIGIVTHKLNDHWSELPHRYKATDMFKKRFAYRWLNVYSISLIVTIILSAVGNYTHVVEFTNPELQVFIDHPGLVNVYQVLFGLALPGVSFVFARVLSTMRQSEQAEDPLFAKAKADLKEAKSTIREKENTIRSLNETIRHTEQRLDESEQRYRAVGDVVRYLFGTDIALRERIRGIRMTFPELSQNGISQLIGCSTSTVNEALQGFEPDPSLVLDVDALPETLDVQS